MDSPRKQILVAECDPIVLAVVNYLLTRQGYAVEAHSGAAEAGRSLRAKHFDVALICSTLSDRAWLQSLFSDVPRLRGRVILMGKAPESGDLPLWAVLEKPVDFELMLTTVRRCLESKPD